MVNPSRCSCVRSLQSKSKSNNPRNKKKRSSSALAEVETALRDSSSLQASAHLSYVDQTQTIQVDRSALPVNRATRLIHSTVVILNTVVRVKSHETCKARVCSASLEAVAQAEGQALDPLTTKRVNRE